MAGVFWVIRSHCHVISYSGSLDDICWKVNGALVLGSAASFRFMSFIPRWEAISYIAERYWVLNLLNYSCVQRDELKHLDGSWKNFTGSSEWNWRLLKCFELVPRAPANEGDQVPPHNLRTRNTHNIGFHQIKVLRGLGNMIVFNLCLAYQCNFIDNHWLLEARTLIMFRSTCILCSQVMT